MATPQTNVILATETLGDEIIRRRQQMQMLHRARQERNKKQTQPAMQTEDSGTVLSPLAVSILGMEGSLPTRQTRRTPQGELVVVPEPLIASVPASPVPRTSRRAQSHYNAFQTTCSPASDGPPSYATAIRHRPAAGRLDEGREVLPKYTCSVSAEAKLLLNLESIDPLHTATEGEWREMYVIVRGTMLNIHRLKDGGPGKFLRSYTLQHAEVGLATDASHTVLVPQSRLAQFIPSAARNKAWKKDPHLFHPERQTILRLRVENDQFLLADSNEERIFQFINAISAGIDIAPSLDERSVPRQCTVPRRRRRPRLHFTGDITDQSVIAEQERILQQMYPTFAEQTEGQANEPPASTVASQSAPQQLGTSAREEDEIDLSAMREDTGEASSSGATSNAMLTPSTTNTSARPAVSRTTTSSSVNSTFNDDMLYESPRTNFTADGKWRPPHTRTEAQILRYTRRCMPIMSADSVRASDVLIANGKRVKINWRMEMLEEWELKPPSYKSHAFPAAKTEESTALERTASNASSSKPAASTPASSRSDVDNVDEIAPVESGLAELDLSKTLTTEKLPSGKPSRSSTLQQQQAAKAREVTREDAGAMFCF